MKEKISRLKKSVLFRSTSSLIILQISKNLFPLITLPYLARVLGPNAYAVRAYLISYMYLLQVVVDFGFNQYGTKLVAEHSEDHEYLSKLNTIVYASKLVLATACLLALLISKFFIKIIDQNLLYSFLAFISTILLSLMPDFILQGIEDMSAIAKRFVVTQLLSVGLIFLFVHKSNDLLLIPIFEGFSALLAVIWTIVYLAKKYKIRFLPFACSDLLGIFRNSIHYFLAAGSSAVMGQIITVLMGFYPLSRHDLSSWTISTTALRGIQTIWQPLARGLYPRMVKTKDFNLLNKILILGSVGAIFATGIGIYFSGYIMLILAGSKYVGDSWILRQLFIMIPFSYVIAILGYPLLGAIGQIRKLSFAIVITGLYQIFGIIILGSLNLFSIQGAVVIRITAEMFLCVLTVTFTARSIIRNKRLSR